MAGVGAALLRFPGLPAAKQVRAERCFQGGARLAPPAGAACGFTGARPGWGGAGTASEALSPAASGTSPSLLEEKGLLDQVANPCC